MSGFNMGSRRTRLWLAAVLVGIGLAAVNFDAIFRIFQPGAANATVYTVVKRAADPLAGLRSVRDRPAGNRKYLVNGKPLLGRLSYSDDPPHRILSRLAAREARLAGAAASTVSDTDLHHIQQILNQPLRVEDDTWGMYARVDWLQGGDTAQPQRQDFLVFALGGTGGNPTDVWTFRFPQYSSPLDFFNQPGEEVPGVANSPVEPYPQAKRVWSLSEFTDIGSGHLEIYTAAGSVDGHRVHFVDSLSARGYKLYRDTATEDQKRLLQFSGRGREIDILVSRSESFSGQITDVVQFRQ